MPKFDGTGPTGQGSMTGRGLGPCGIALGWKKRYGFGCCMGRCCGWCWPQAMQDPKKALAEYKKALEEELEDVKKEEEELNKEG